MLCLQASSTEFPGQLNSNVGGKPPARSTRNPAPNYVDAVIASIDFSKPPPNMWSASKSELIDINKSIGSNDVWSRGRQFKKVFSCKTVLDIP